MAAARGGRQSSSTTARARLWALRYPILTYWYFHLPNFVLAALMYTLLGRALLGLIVEPDSQNYIWRFFCRITDPVVAARRAGHAEGRGAGRGLAVRRRLAVLAARRAALSSSSSLGAVPAHELSAAMDRNFYYIGIAFFGMINGLFNPDSGCCSRSSMCRSWRRRCCSAACR